MPAKDSLGVSPEQQGVRRIRRASSELVEQVLQLSNSGATCSQIAKELNLDADYVRPLIRRTRRRHDRRNT